MADALQHLVAGYLARRHGVTDREAVDALLTAVAAGHCRADVAPERLGAAIGSVLTADAAGVALGRHAHAEARLAGRVCRLLAHAPVALTPADVTLVRTRFPQAGATIDLQAIAVVAALRNHLTVIAGGPGTGKTTVAATVVEALVARQPDLAVRLATPTGKAAARLRESLGASTLAPAMRARLQAHTATLHRHLGVRPDGGPARHHAGNPLPCDLLILDEVSMIDVELLADALDALPAHARVVLLGDRHQLASVEAGYALGDLVAAAGTGAGAGLITACQDAGLVPPSGTSTAPLAEAVVTLQVSRRFRDDRGIGAWARAVNAGTLPTTDQPEVQRLSPEALVDRAVDHARQVLAAADPATALARLSDFRLLTPIRAGRLGVEGLNRTIAARLDLAPGAAGTPILITANDSGTGLANGDVGIIRDGRAWFTGDDGAPRAVTLARLPPWEPAWAMTIHKSQGSEFTAVGILLPPMEPTLLVRELLYTALTRARASVLLAAEDSMLRTCVSASAARRTGLAALLRA